MKVVSHIETCCNISGENKQANVITKEVKIKNKTKKIDHKVISDIENLFLIRCGGRKEKKKLFLRFLSQKT